MSTLFATSLKRSLYLALALSALGIKNAEAQVTVLHNFAEGPSANPRGSLELVGDRLFGITEPSSNNLQGVVFSIGLDGSDFTVIHDSPSVRGGDVVSVGDKLYGIDSDAPPELFSLDTDGSNFEILNDFSSDPTPFPGQQPNPGHVENNGALVVSGSRVFGPVNTDFWGPNIFSYDTQNSQFDTFLIYESILDSFTEDNLPITLPDTILAGPVIHEDRLYGTTRDTILIESLDPYVSSPGGAAVFSVGTDGSDYELLHSFADASIGTRHGVTLFENQLFGIAYQGQSRFIYRLNLDGSDFEIATPLPNTSLFSIQLIPVGSRLYGTYQSGDAIHLFSLGAEDTDLRVELVTPTADIGTSVNELVLIGNRLYGTTRFGGEFGGGTLFFVTVPEPSSAALIAVGSMALCLYRRWPSGRQVIACGLLLSVFISQLPQQAIAGPLSGHANAYNDGNGPDEGAWTGTADFLINGFDGGTVEWAVFGPNQFPTEFPGLDGWTPTTGELTYAYQIINTSSFPVDEFQVYGGLDSVLTNPGAVDLGGGGEVPPQSTSAFPGGGFPVPIGPSILYRFYESDPFVDHSIPNPSGVSSGLVFNSPNTPLLSTASGTFATTGVRTNFASTSPEDFGIVGIGEPTGPPLTTLDGDFDEDGDVDGADFLKWQRGMSPMPLSQTDLNNWEMNYGMVAPLAASATVPEPSTLVLVLLVMGGASRGRRRR